MSFPENPLFTFFYWLINTPGVGGIAVGVLALGIAVTVGLTLRWIGRGGQADDGKVYAYPTPALHHHSKAD